RLGRGPGIAACGLCSRNLTRVSSTEVRPARSRARRPVGVAILLCTALAERARVPAPILLVGSGILLGFVPALRGVHLPPELMLLIFLPLLLYWESLSTSLREIRRNLTGIAVMSTLLVIATVGAVAVLAHLWGMSWGRWCSCRSCPEDFVRWVGQGSSPG